MLKSVKTEPVHGTHDNSVDAKTVNYCGKRELTSFIEIQKTSLDVEDSTLKKKRRTLDLLERYCLRNDIDKSEATIRLKIENFGDFWTSKKIRVSEAAFARGLSWKLRARRRGSFLSVFIRAYSDSSSWSCNVSATYKMIPKSPLVIQQHQMERSNTFTAAKSCYGCSKFIKFQKLMTTARFLHNDTLILEAHIRAKEPYGLLNPRLLPKVEELVSAKEEMVTETTEDNGSHTEFQQEGGQSPGGEKLDRKEELVKLLSAKCRELDKSQAENRRITVQKIELERQLTSLHEKQISELSEVSSKLENSEGENTKLTTEINGSNAEKQELKSEMKKLEKQISELFHEKESIQSKEEELKSSKEANDKLKSDRNHCHAQHQRIYAAKSELTKQITLLREKESQQSKEFERRLKYQEGELNKVKAATHALHAENMNMEKQITSFKEKESRKSKEFETLKEENVKLIAQRNKCQMEYRLNKAEKIQLEKQIALLEEKESAMQEELETALEEKAGFKMERHELLSKNRKCNLECSSLTQQKAKLVAKNRQIANEKKKIEEQLTEEKKETQSKQLKEVETVKKALKENSNLKMERHDLLSKNRKCQRECSLLVQQKNELAAKKCQMEIEKKKIQEQLVELKEKKTQQTKQVEKLKEMKEKCDKLVNEKDEIIANNRRCESESLDLFRQNKELSAKIQQMENEKVDLEKRIQDLANEKELNSIVKVETLGHDYNMLETRITELNTKNLELLGQLEAQKQNMEALKQEIMTRLIGSNR